MPGIPLLQGLNPVGDLYSQALSSLYHNSWRIIEPSFAQEKEGNVWELIQRDPTIEQAILQRRSIIAAKTWQVVPATKDEPDVLLADLVREVLEGIEGFASSRAMLANAVFRAREYAYIRGRRRLHRFQGASSAREWWLPNDLQHVDKLRIQYTNDRTDDGGFRTRPQLFSIRRRQWEDIAGGLRHKFVSVKFGDEESRLGYGRGLLDTLYFLWWAGSRVMKDMLQGVERSAQGTRIGKVDTTKRAASGKDADTQMDDMLDVLEKAKGRHEIVIDKDDDLVIEDAPTGGLQFAQGVFEKIESLKIAVCMGSVRPFGANVDTGSFAQAKTEADTADERTEFDRAVIDEAITSDLIGCFMYRNRRELAAEGLGQARRPKFQTSSQKIDDPRANAERAQIFLQYAPIKTEELYEIANFEQPKEGDDVISPAAPGQVDEGHQFLGLEPSLHSVPGSPSSPPVSGAAGPSTPDDPNSPEPDILPSDQTESELLGKVGGITGAIEIFKALSEDAITKETAIRMFMLFFHLSPQEAGKLVGKSGEAPPNPPTNDRDPDARAISERQRDPRAEPVAR